MLDVLSDVLAGEQPSVQDVMLIRSVILTNQSIYVPLGIEQQLMEMNMDVSGPRIIIDHGCACVYVFVCLFVCLCGCL